MKFLRVNDIVGRSIYLKLVVKEKLIYLISVLVYYYRRQQEKFKKDSVPKFICQ